MSRPTDPERFLPLRTVHFHVLLSLVEAPSHGYGIRRVVDERTEGRIVLAAGTLYETLQRLERDGLISETPRPKDAEDASSRWRFYALAPLGREVLALELRRLESDVAIARAQLASAGIIS